MPNGNSKLTPDDILSFVEDEIGGLEASRWTPEARTEMLDRIRSRPADLALYEQLRSNARALRSLPHLDAPASVWDEIEARFDATLEGALESERNAASRSPKLSWAIRVRRRLAVSAAAAACLLVAVGGALWFASPDNAPTPSQRILFVQADPKPNEYRASMAVAEFLTKVTQRYRGVSADELDRILHQPATDE